MSDLIQRAREDLTRVKPDVWVEVYAERLLDASSADGGSRLGALTRVLGCARRMVETVTAALDAFEKATGWDPKPPRARRLKATPQRWRASVALALSTRRAVQAFLVASRPSLSQISGADAMAAAERLEKVLEAVRKTGSDPACAAALHRFEDSIRRLRNRILELTRHPAAFDPAFVEAGSVEALVAERGQCATVKAGGRCWLYAGHPGKCHPISGGRPL